MIVGPKDVGKSTVSEILLNYAVRMGRRPIFVDLDVGQGSIGVSGSIGAVLVERPAAIEESGFSDTAPFILHYGHTSPGQNGPLFSKLTRRMADVVRDRMDKNRKAKVSGVVINTCGWIREEGYQQIKQIAEDFEVSVILVLDQERLYNDLVRDMPEFVDVVLIPKSGGVFERSSDLRAKMRIQKVRKYFYGSQAKNLFPHSFEVKFGDLKDKIYKIGAPALPDSCMPLGMTSDGNQTKLVQVQPNPRDLQNRILAVSFAAKTEDLLATNVAGFICVTEVNMKDEKLTVLAPQPRPLPDDKFLLVSDLQFVDSS